MSVLLKLLTSVMDLAGTLGAAVIVANSGVCLAHAGNDSVSGSSQPANETTGLLRSKMRLVNTPIDRVLPDDDGLEDVVLTFRKQYHFLRLLRLESEEAFLYVVMDRSYANLALTRHKVCEFEKQLFEDRRRVLLMEQRLRLEREKRGKRQCLGKSERFGNWNRLFLRSRRWTMRCPPICVRTRCGGCWDFRR